MSEFEWKRKKPGAQSPPASPQNCSRFCEQSVSQIDDAGHPWCSACIDRYRFMQWGIGYGFPDIFFGRYALAPDAEIYFYQAILASDEYIQLALAAMQELDRLIEERKKEEVMHGGIPS